MKKSVLSVLSCILFLFILSGCSKASDNPEVSDRLSAVKASGVLTVAMSPDFPPYEYLSSGKLQGVDVEIAKYIADQLGVKLKIEQSDFDTVLMNTAGGTCDLGISAIMHSEDREQNLLFSDPYLFADTEYGYHVQTDANALCVVSAKGGYSDSLIYFVNNCIAALRQEGKINEWYRQYS